MTDKALILGGYGNFGARIAEALTVEGFSVLINGRDAAKAQKLVDSLPQGLAEAAVFDVRQELTAALERYQPSVVIHTAGPFQGNDYHVAKDCIAARVHYLDLADARDFVTGFSALDADAKTAHVMAVSGASSVPALSSAVIEHFRAEFSQLECVDFGITPGQKAARGLATTQAIMGYIGKPLKPVMGKPLYGWQNIRSVRYPAIGHRWLANCDIPDLDLFPQHYGFQDIRFGAGLELGFMHWGLWLASWLIRMGIPLPLERLAKPLLHISNVFDAFGTADGGMFVKLTGKGRDGLPYRREWYLEALDGDGPYIPAIPAIILAKKCLSSTGISSGAQACVGLVTLEEYLQELHGKRIYTHA